MIVYIAKTVRGSFDSVIADITARLREQGFGILADIDVQATLESEIGVEMPRYRILGACNPELARDALKVENKVAVLLPCNIIVRETSDKGIEVAALDPVSSMERSGNAGLRPTTHSLRRLLSIAVSAVGT